MDLVRMHLPMFGWIYSCGHLEIGMALVKLYRETGERRYLDLAGFLVD